MPFYASRGDYQANGNLYESDIVGSIANAIGSQVGKLNPQIVRQTAGAGLQIKDGEQNTMEGVTETKFRAENEGTNSTKLSSDHICIHAHTHMHTHTHTHTHT